MSLTFHSRTVGGITIVKCEGRIVEGPDSAALRRHVNDILEKRSAVLLNLGGVEFIDSAGLGVLVRILARAGQDGLKLCALSPKLADVLRITKLSTVFDCYESEADAIAAFYQPATASRRAPQFLSPSVLCVEDSADVLTYLQELLHQAGFTVSATDNVHDAVILLKAMTPKVVLVSSELRSGGSARTLEALNRLLETVAVVELPSDFATQDPGETSRQLVDRVRALISAAEFRH